MPRRKRKAAEPEDPYAGLTEAQRRFITEPQEKEKPTQVRGVLHLLAACTCGDHLKRTVTRTEARGWLDRWILAHVGPGHDISSIGVSQ